MNYTISVTQLKKGNYYISLTYQGKRYRFYNGNAIGMSKSPNRYPAEERRAAFEDLKLNYQLALRNGWTPENVKSDKKDQGKITGPATTDHLWLIYEGMKQENYSTKYLKDIYYYVSNISTLCNGEITEDTFSKFLSTKKHWSNTSYNNARRVYRCVRRTFKRIWLHR